MLENIVSEPIENSKPENFVKGIGSFLKEVAYDAVIVLAYVAGGIALAAGVSGCQLSGEPRPRLGTLPTPPPGPRFCDPNNLGKHSYNFNPFEKNGIVYTRKAGHIDITHVRCNADHARYLIRRTKETLIKNKEGFSFQPAWEISKHYVKFNYPAYWDNLSNEEKEKIATQISFKIGPYLSYNANTWHEILTWFGTHFAGFEPQFNSAFSWEDMYSNILGIQLAVEALKDPSHNYDEAMTLAIDRKLRKLGVQPKSIAIYASKKMRGKWFKGIIFVDTIRRNIDIGLVDGYVTPVLVPSICEGAEPEPLPVPTLDILSEYGFSMKYEIDPKVWEKDKILSVLNQDGKKRIEPEKDYPEIMGFIKEQAVEEYGYDVGVPSGFN